MDDKSAKKFADDLLVMASRIRGHHLTAKQQEIVLPALQDLQAQVGIVLLRSEKVTADVH